MNKLSKCFQVLRNNLKKQLKPEDRILPNYNINDKLLESNKIKSDEDIINHMNKAVSELDSINDIENFNFTHSYNSNISNNSVSTKSSIVKQEGVDAELNIISMDNVCVITRGSIDKQIVYSHSYTKTKQRNIKTGNIKKHEQRIHLR